MADSTAPSATDARAKALETLRTLFELGREVTSVLDLDQLLHKIPELIARLIKYQAFAVYLLDSKRNELAVAYSVGYAPEVAHTLRLKVGEGLVDGDECVGPSAQRVFATPQQPLGPGRSTGVGSGFDEELMAVVDEAAAMQPATLDGAG